MPGLTLSELLKKMIELGGSDLHITTNSAPRVRVHGKLRPMDMAPLTAADTKALAYSVLTDAQKHRFEENLELDFSFGLKNLARFRGNLFQQRGAVGAVFRTIPWEIKNFDALGLPAVVKGLCDKPRGLVLVTGPTGSGKSTTLAAMLDKINSEREEHMITIEDPIEFLHNHKKMPGEPARSAFGYAFLCELPARRASRRPRRGSDRRNARSGNDRVRAAHCRNGALDLRHAAHQLRDLHDQPNRGRIPVLSATADSRAAFDGARRGPLPVVAAAGGWAGTRDGHGSFDSRIRRSAT